METPFDKTVEAVMANLDGTFNELRRHPYTTGQRTDAAAADEICGLLQRAAPVTDVQRIVAATIRWIAKKNRSAFINQMFRDHYACASLYAGPRMIETALGCEKHYSVEYFSDGRLTVGPPAGQPESGSRRSARGHRGGRGRRAPAGPEDRLPPAASQWFGLSAPPERTRQEPREPREPRESREPREPREPRKPRGPRADARGKNSHRPLGADAPVFGGESLRRALDDLDRLAAEGSPPETPNPQRTPIRLSPGAVSYSAAAAAANASVSAPEKPRAAECAPEPGPAAESASKPVPAAESAPEPEPAAESASELAPAAKSAPAPVSAAESAPEPVAAEKLAAKPKKATIRVLKTAPKTPKTAVFVPNAGRWSDMPLDQP
jgi:hypothetical protein